MENVNYKELARQARIKVLEMVHRGKTSHIASNFSVLDIMTVLYENLKNEDEVLVSKGWVAASVYYFLAQQGKIPKEDLDKFPNPPYLGLAEVGVPGVWVSGGSVGQGLSVAVGMAYAKKLKNESGRIFCIMSDGELDEGTTWEAVRIAARHKLNNLVAIIDKNSWQAMGRTEEVNGGNPRDAFSGHGWATMEIDGHNHELIEGAIYSTHESKPIVIVAETTKGKGVSFMEDSLVFHYRHVDDDVFNRAMKELNVA